MASFFEEMGLLDRPFVDVKLKIGGKDVTLKAQYPSAHDQDFIDAFFMDEYARILADKTKAEEGKVSERERIRSIYAARSKAELVEQLLPTRSADIRQRAAQLGNIDINAEALKMMEMTDDERKKYVELKEEEMKTYMDEARAEVQNELLAMDDEELVNRLTDINLNIQINALAKRNVDSRYIYYTLYRRNEDGTPGKKAFDTPEQVTQELTATTITEFSEAIRAALDTDLPFESPADDAPAGQPSSPSTSAADTEVGGTPTETTSAS